MKKIIPVLIILIILAVAAWLILLRPSDYTEEIITADFKERKDSFAVMAEYLTENKINATIEGLLSVDERYGVPRPTDEDAYRGFNDANTVIMREKVYKVISDGKKVEFCYLDEGGILNRTDARIIYDTEKKTDGKELGGGWYLCME